MTKKLLIYLSLLIAFPIFSLGQQVPFTKGVNLTNWFQSNSATQIPFGKYSKLDFEQIQSLGCDVIRLPINLHAMTNGAPDYVLDPLFVSFLDQAVDWAEEVGIHLILDNHTFDVNTNTDPNIYIPLEKVWKQMAAHYKNRTNYLHYEVLNEPHGISSAIWGSIQQRVIDTIRTVDTKHSIVVGPVNFNNFTELVNLPFYADTNLIYTFHFYDPFVFTHQGATWVSPSMAPLANIPFPFHPDSMPGLPSGLQGTWVGDNYNAYGTSGNVSFVQNLIDIAVQFQQTRNVPVFCGEFGVYIPNSQDRHRNFWYDEVRTYLEANNIPWTIWDYEGGFGIYDLGGNGLFDHDLNIPLVEALGFIAPPQSEFVVEPDTSGFIIYSDFVEEGMSPVSFGTAEINYYDDDFAAYGERNIKWGGPEQYNQMGFDFSPNRDLSTLVAQNYALDLFVRGTPTGTDFDIRFLDTFTDDPNDLPWRMRTTITDAQVIWDGSWNHLHIPLSSFTEHGSWDGSTWHNPRGEFDWTAIDLVEIVSEHKSQPNANIWFDQIQISNLDTAMTTTSIVESFPPGTISVFPNPAFEQLTITSQWQKPLHYELRDPVGRIIEKDTVLDKKRLMLGHLSSGIYVLRVHDGTKYQSVRKIWKR